MMTTKICEILTYQNNWHGLYICPLYPEANTITPGTREPQPTRQFQQVSQDNFVQLQIAQFAFSFQRAQVDPVRREVFRIPETMHMIKNEPLRDCKQANLDRCLKI